MLISWVFIGQITEPVRESRRESKERWNYASRTSKCLCVNHCKFKRLWCLISNKHIIPIL